MTKQVKIWAVLPAAGLGARMGAACPKQYISLVGKPVLYYSLAIMAQHPKIERVVVVIHPNDRNWQQLKLPVSWPVITVIGGATRATSVLRGLQALDECADDDDWVIVHDAARPCLQTAWLDRLIAQLADHPVGGLLAMPVTDTLKQFNSQTELLATCPREDMWLAQTPQMFRYKLLKMAVEQALKAGQVLTDEASALERIGHKVQLVMGDVRNMKMTYQDDLLIAENCLNNQLELVDV